MIFLKAAYQFVLLIILKVTLVKDVFYNQIVKIIAMLTSHRNTVLQFVKIIIMGMIYQKAAYKFAQAIIIKVILQKNAF